MDEVEASTSFRSPGNKTEIGLSCHEASSNPARPVYTGKSESPAAFARSSPPASDSYHLRGNFYDESALHGLQHLGEVLLVPDTWPLAENLDHATGSPQAIPCTGMQFLKNQPKLALLVLATLPRG